MTANEMFDEFYSSFLYYFEISFPKTVQRLKTKDDEWITNTIRHSQELVKNLYWETRISTNPQAKENYKVAKTNHSKLILNTKKEFY